VDPKSVNDGTIERAALIFFFLEQVEDRCITKAAPVLVTMLRSDDTIIALEAERVLKRLLHHLKGSVANRVTEELENFNQRITEAIINSQLVEIK
ncbi:MAG: hypothetical protein ACFFD4_11000, partial [Candidatus Odinarchaeota archaeon]